MARSEPTREMVLRPLQQRKADRTVGELFEMLSRRIVRHHHRHRLDEHRRSGDQLASQAVVDHLPAGEERDVVFAGAGFGERLLGIVLRNSKRPLARGHGSDRAA